MTRRVLLIGGGSAIGTAVVAALTDPVVIRTTRTGAAADAALPLEVLASHRSVLETLFGEQGFDLVILAAGSLPEEHDAAELRRYARTDLVGASNVIAIVGELLERTGGGRLLLLSSMSAVRLRPGRRWYGATKRSLEAAARQIARRDHVQSTVVRAGRVDTPMSAGRAGLGPVQTPEAAAQRIVRGVHRGSRTVYTSPALRLVALALRVTPSWVLRRLAPGADTGAR